MTCEASSMLNTLILISGAVCLQKQNTNIALLSFLFVMFIVGRMIFYTAIKSCTFCEKVKSKHINQLKTK